MKIIACCICAAVGLLLCGNIVAAERKGFQAVALSKLSDASVGNLVAAIRESRCREFEFAYMPFFNRRNPFNNVDTLLAIPKVGKIETIFLSWRDEELMNEGWETARATLEERAGEVNRHLNEVLNKVEKIVLVPMLEDQWTEARWLEAVHIITGQLDSGDRIFFRRSVNSGSDMPPSTISARLKNGKSHTFTSTRLEAHRINHGGEAQVISNDGRLVFQDARILGTYETKYSLNDGAGESRSLASWTAEANATAKISILWRPSYNLFTRTYADGRITYQKPDELAEKRTDSDSDPAVNAFEKEVLKSFLQ